MDSVQRLEIEPDYQQRLGAFAAHCEVQVEAGLQQERSGEVLQVLLRHVRQITDEEIASVRMRQRVKLACEPGCDACCYRTVDATIPELVDILSGIDALAEPERDGVVARALNYEGAGSACPLLDSGRCLLYDSRPLSCRGVNSCDSRPCQAWRRKQDPKELRLFKPQDAVAQAAQFGLRKGLFWEGLDKDLVDLGKALQERASGQTRAKYFSAGRAYFSGEAVADLSRLANPADALCRSNAAEINPPALQSSTQPSGNVCKEEERSLDEYNRLALHEGKFKEAIQSLDRGNALHAIANVVVPRVYRTEEEMFWWRDHFVSAMQEFSGSLLPDIDKFNALSLHRTAGLAYQGMDDKQIMVEHGRICADVTRRAVPDLTGPIEHRKRKDRLRLGYLSANMHGSNGCRWALGWLRNHGPEIETFALNVGTIEDGISKQFRAHADHYFHLVRPIVENARFIKNLELDAIIFTDIGLHGFNTSYATMRLAPVQCTAWGHPVTSGYPTIDYYLSSELMEPEGGDGHYAEKLVRLPRTGLTYEPIEDFPKLGRSHFGLPEYGPLIVNVQTKPKLLPQYDCLYAQVAEKADAPIVFLEGFHPCDTLITKERMAKAGVRSHWLPHLKRPEFLALLALADVSLDPPLWSGGNTTIEALSSGTPVVTLPGPFMRSRHGSAFLTQANAAGLIANSESEYVDIATNPERRRNAMKDIDANALFDNMEPVKALDQFLRSGSYVSHKSHAAFSP